MQMQVDRISPALLRVMLAFQWLTVGLALYFGQMYLDWQTVPDELFKRSPDAYHNMMDVLFTWWMLKGASVAVAINMAFLAFEWRREIATGSWLVKLHWICFLLPIPVIFWFGRNIK